METRAHHVLIGLFSVIVIGALATTRMRAQTLRGSFG
ncbi:hypothetical protein, partial [Pseudomonas aeruginosa]